MILTLVKFIYLFFLLVFSSPGFSQQEYFSQENKKQGLEHYQNKIYRGCSDLKIRQDPVSKEEMERLIFETQKIVEENFKKAFEENPKVKLAFQKDLSLLKQDGSCQRLGNDCRARMLSLSLYYYQQFRPDLFDCEDQNEKRCEMEEKYRKVSLQGVRNNYGKLGPGSYKKELIAQKNNTTIKLFNMIMHTDKENLHICNKAGSGVAYRYSLNVENEGEYQTGMDPDYNPNIKIVQSCVEEKKILLSEFISTPIDASRSTVGQDLVEPIKSHIINFIKSNSDMFVTDVLVTSSSAKIPFFITVSGKRTIDPKSDEKNLTLASERSMFMARALASIKSSELQFAHINMSVKAELAGPDFVMMDLNHRFVTKMSPGYLQRITAVYNQHSKIFKGQALINAPEDLLNETKYPNLYQVKYKPFEGFRIQIQGHIKSESKCQSKSSGGTPKSRSSRQ